MSEPVKLKYLFVAEYTDGTREEQTPDDVSRLDLEGKRSQYYDVLQSGKDIKKFSLVGSDHTVSVDLKDGIFAVDGFPLLLESQRLPTLPDKFELVFYRQHTHDMNITYEKKTGDITDQKEGDHFIEYFIGWKCIIAGKEYIQKLAVA